MNPAHARGAASSANQGNAAHNVPRPPYAGGTANNQVARSSIPSNPATHNVPRPPANNDSFARRSDSINTRGGMNGSSQGTAGAPTAHNAQAPRPPANYSYHAPSGTSRQSSPSHQSAPAQHAAPQGNQHGSSHSDSTARSRASGSVPRPPAGYSYHAAPAHSASSPYAAGRMGTSSYGGSGRSSYSSGSYYGSNRSYGSGSTYGARNYGSSGSPSAPRYSARHYSGGSGGSYHSSGGSSNHGGSSGGSPSGVGGRHG